MDIIKAIVKFFTYEPKFKAGDIIRTDEEFPDAEMDLLIVNVGKEQYQYMFARSKRHKYSARIEYFDRNFKKVE